MTTFAERMTTSLDEEPNRHPEPFRVLSSDILISDVCISLPYNDTDEANSHGLQYSDIESFMAKILKRRNAQRGGKAAVFDDEYEELCKKIAGLEHKRSPGGSSANTLVTLGRLLGKKHIATDFIGVAGTGEPAESIKRDLVSGNVHLLPEHPPEHRAAIHGTTIAFTQKNGERTTFTHRGNAADILTPEMVTPDLMEKCDAVFVQGSLWDKFGKDLPDKMLIQRWQKDKEIWLALPTHSKFDASKIVPETCQWQITSADVVLGNDAELLRIYKTDNLQIALAELKQALGERDKVREAKHKPRKEKKPVAFITCEKGAYVVTPGEENIFLPALPAPKEMYMIGAGDTAFAGFLAGHVAGMSLHDSAELGMELANAKLEYESARIPDPRQELLDKHNDRTNALLKLMDEGLAARHGAASGVSALHR